MVEKSICQYCNEEFQPSELSVHLIEKSKGNEESNSIILCKKCHAKVHSEKILDEELKEIRRIGNIISIKKRGISIGIMLILSIALILIYFLNVRILLLVFLINCLAGAYGGYNLPHIWQKWVKWVSYPPALFIIPLVLLSIYLSAMAGAGYNLHDVSIVIVIDIFIIIFFFIPILIGAYIGSKIKYSE